MRLVVLIAVPVCLALGQDSSAEIELRRKAVQDNPRDAEARARLGIAYRNSGRLRESAEELEKSLKLNANLPRVPTLLAFVYISGGRYAEAIPHLRATFRNETDVEFRVVVGQRLVECLFATSGQDEALDIIRELCRLKPDDPDVLYLTAKAHANAWNATVQRLLEKSAGSYRAHQILAETLETQEKYAEAANEYRTIIKLQPKLPSFHYKLGKMLLRADPSPEGERLAMAEFLAELAVNPFDVPSLLEAGGLHLKAGRTDEAREAFRKAILLQPGQSLAHLGMARAMIAGRDYETALRSLDEAGTLAPQNEAVPYQKMIALRSLGRLAEARTAQALFQKLKAERERTVTDIRTRLKGMAPAESDAR
ncbi:MAG: tetratricopeptide repeat protein [Bryobacterales bacterium]|nr:tetratricopeptide repeat protein [Bryobacterales bacterium]